MMDGWLIADLYAVIAILVLLATERAFLGGRDADRARPAWLACAMLWPLNIPMGIYFVIKIWWGRRRA